VASPDDLYAKGWDAALEQARRLLTQHLDRPDLALDRIHQLLIDGHRARRGRVRA
jgi:hypothetical protein